MQENIMMCLCISFTIMIMCFTVLCLVMTYKTLKGK